MKVLVTGASGFAGSHLFRHFAALACNMYGSGRSEKAPEGFSEYGEYIQMDFAKPLKGKKTFDTIIHCAAETNPSAAKQSLSKSNTRASAILRDEFECSKMIYISSSSVYDYGINIPESSAGSGMSSYGRSKYESEEILKKGIGRNYNSLCILRPRAIYGSGDRQLLAKLLHLNSGGVLNWPGRQDTVSSLTHIQNLCEAAEACFRKESSGITEYNIADNKVYNLFNSVNSLLEETNEIKLKPRFSGAWRLLPLLKLLYGNNGKHFELKQVSSSLTLDITKIKNELNFTPRHEFSASDIARWYHQKQADKFPVHSWPWL